MRSFYGIKLKTRKLASPDKAEFYKAVLETQDFQDPYFTQMHESTTLDDKDKLGEGGSWEQLADRHGEPLSTAELHATAAGRGQ